MTLARCLRRHLPTFQVAALAGAIAATLIGTAALSRTQPAPPASSAAAVEDDESGALIGDLVFHADLLAALDRLCPPRAAATDWHGALRPLLDDAFTPELRALSQRLGADAGAQMVQQRGGCHTRGYAAAYGESRGEYRALLQRWKALDND